jgi:NAD(P)-dependent dehydrogenase (short-subunit alcohol dehydrogenase family)
MAADKKVAVITGAGSGIGLATAQRLARDGVAVILADLNDTCTEAAQAIRDEGGDARACRADVRDEHSVQALFDFAVSELGAVDILVNNAGVVRLGRVTDTSAADWDYVLDTNLKGAFLCARAAITLMQDTDGGSIVNVASEQALIGAPELAAYCSSKGGVVQLTRALAVDHAIDNIRVNCVCPGPVSTPMLEAFFESLEDPESRRQDGEDATLMRRFADPGEIANVIRFVASEEASYMTGSIVVVDGGATAQ